MFSERTRLVVFNNPLNPSATVSRAEDFALLAEFCVRYDVVAVCDEVWEHVVLRWPRAPASCWRFAACASDGCGRSALPARCSPSPAGRSGFICAAFRLLITVIAKAHQFLTFTTPPNLQAAVAWGLDNAEAWFASMPPALEASRDRLTEALRREGFAVLPSQGTYFLNVDLAASGVTEERHELLRCARCGRPASPAFRSSVFYEEALVTHLLRLLWASPSATRRWTRARNLLAKARALSLQAQARTP